MRHGNKGNHLGRTMEHRRALLSNLAIALITHKRIETTLAKAKSLRQYIEPIITRAKQNTTHSRRVIFSYLQNKEAIKELFGAVATEVGDRPGGYVRVIRTGFRKGDAAEMALIELVDFNPDYSGKAKSDKTGEGKRRRTRRSGGGTAKAAVPAAVSTADTTPVAEEIREMKEEVVELKEQIHATQDEIAATEQEQQDATSDKEKE